MNVGGRKIRISGKMVRIARLDADKYRFLDAPEAFVEELKKSGLRADLFTFMQRLPHTTAEHKFPMEWDNFAAIPLTTFDQWWTKQIGFKARNKAKQAEKKGVVLREVAFNDELVRGIWEIYNECPIRQGRRFPHYGKSLQTVHDEEATYLDSSVFLGAYSGDKLIGFSKLVMDETHVQAGLMNIVSLIRERDKAPTNALVAQAVRSCTERGVQYLVYSNFAYGKKQSDSLSDFKERNAFQRIDVPRYYVPLTAFGALAFRMRLHHRLVDRFPESFASKLRAYRTAWYNRKFQMTAEAS
jgi:hypothetical protein